MRNYLKDGIILLLALIGLSIYTYKQIDWNAPKQKSISHVNIDGKMYPLQGVRVVQIPPAVYDSISANTPYKDFLLGDQKRVVLITWNGCPYARAFRHAFDKAFRFKELNQNYKPRVIEVGQTVSFSCNSDNLNCPKAWVISNCINGFCIINPQAKQAILDGSRNAKQIIPLLVAYAKWTQESLVEQ